MKITLLGNPKSTQHIYGITCAGKFPRNYMTHEGKGLKEQYQWEAKSQWREPVSKEKMAMEITLYFGDRRKRDIDNFNKLILDALAGIVYEDDVQIHKLVIIKEYDKENPRIEINIL